MVERAAEAGLAAIAIADHDVVSGLPEAQAAADELGLELLPAVELTADWDGKTVHVLGYGIDPAEPRFVAALERGRLLMAEHVAAVLAEVRKAGFELSEADLERYNTRYATGASVLLGMLQARILRDAPNALALLRLASREPRAYTAQEAIALVHGAGGLASMAHPARGRKDKPLHTADELRPLVEAGLDALEVWHIIHDAARRAHYAGLANELGLLPTGGSDCHGPRKSGIRIGTQRVPYEVVEAIRERRGG